MGLLTFSLNLTLDGCVDHREGIADDETHAFFTRLMDEGGAMLWGRVTYEMMESYWLGGRPRRRGAAAGDARVGGPVGGQAEVRGVQDRISRARSGLYCGFGTGFSMSQQPLC
jgi:hypothetical protein